MEDIRLPETKFEFDGKEYILRCNFNVLAEIQEVNGGTIPDITNTKKSLGNFMLILSAMMNDYADEQGWDERISPKQLGRKLGMPDVKVISEVMKLFIRATYSTSSKNESTQKN